MGNIVNEQRSTTALVEKYIGTAYDKMVAIYDNLTALLSLEVQLTEFNNNWQGVLTEAPVLRPDGTALLEGDQYYNSTSKALFIFVSGVWQNANALSSTVENIVIGAGNLVGGDTVVTLSSPYTVGRNTLIVFVGSVYQYSKSVDVNGAYTETDEVTITFDGALLDIGENVTVIIGVPLPTVNPIISIETGLYLVETEGQTLIELPNAMTYSVGTSNIEVYVNGLFQFSSLDYLETSPTTITLSIPLSINDAVVFKIGTLISNDATAPNSASILALDSSFFNNNALDITKPIITKGSITTGDGYGGIFVYDVTYSKAEANGVTVIDSSKSKLLQGTGIGNGCWVRQYSDDLCIGWFNTPNRGMAAIRSLKGIPGDTVNLQGFYEDEYVGGGVFVWDATRNATEHNGGTIISPLVSVNPGTASWYTAPVSGTGCWVRQETDNLNVSWFGGKPSLSYDSTLAFEGAAAIGNAQVAPGTYTIAGAVSGVFYTFSTAGAVVITPGTVTTVNPLL